MFEQIAGSLHDAELHLVHTRDDPDGEETELLVVGLLLDAREHGWNVQVGVRTALTTAINTKLLAMHYVFVLFTTLALQFKNPDFVCTLQRDNTRSVGLHFWPPPLVSLIKASND